MIYKLSHNSWGQEEHLSIQTVLNSNKLTMGPYVQEFEKQFAIKMGKKFAVMTNSGSSANLIATAALCFKRENPLKPGDEVIVPAISWATTYTPLIQYQLKLRFVDVELETLGLNPNLLEKALTPKTKAVVAVNILGNPCALDKIRNFCDKHHLYLFEDNCESMGAMLGGKYCGTFGDIGTFSSFFSHHISTIEGGICLTDHKELYHLMLSLRSHGWTRDLPDASPIYEKKMEDFFEAYRFILPGYNVRPIEFAGAIGIEQLRKLDHFTKMRRKNGEEWNALFGNDSRFIIQKENGTSSYFSFPLILNPEYGFNRKEILQTLKERGIEYRIITGGNFLRHDVIAYCNHEVVTPIVNANIAHDHGFFVGNSPIDIRPNIRHLHQVLSHI